MTLLSNWRAVLTKAWSVRLMVLAGLLSGAEVAMPYFEGSISLPTGVFAALSGFVTAAALLARIVAQNGVSNEQA
jgi:hypothetical protein